MALYDVNLLSTSTSLNSRTPVINTNQMGWLGQLLLDETDFLPDFLDLSNNFTFRRSCRLPVPRINFSSSLFPLLDTTWALSTVVSISWNSVDLMCAKLWESMKVARFYGERRGPYWYGKEVIGMSVIDFFFCSLSLAPSLSLSLSLSLFLSGFPWVSGRECFMSRCHWLTILQ